MAGSTKRVILIAVDASNHSEEAFNHYMEFLHQPDNEVILLHCPELSNVNMRLLKGDQPPYDEWEKILSEEKQRWSSLQTKYENYLKEKQLKGKFEVHPSSKPGEAIVSAATEKDATLVVTGTRGLGTIRRTVMGSVSDYVVHHSPVPVIVYRPNKK